MRYKIILSIVTALAFASAPFPVAAYDDNAFEADVSRAYAFYRAAASYLRTDNPSIGSLELADAQDQWRNIVAKAKRQTPAMYRDDQQFLAVLADISGILDTSLTLVDAGEIRKAYGLLLGVRDRLYDLRKRNGQRTYADCVTELNRIMDEIWVYRKTPPDFSNRATKTALEGLFIRYDTTLAECHAMAPATYVSSAEYRRVFDLTESSTKESLVAVEQEDNGAFYRMLGEIRSLDRIIFFKFGG